MPVSSRTVRPADGEIRLDRWFHRHFPALTQGALQKMLRSGQIRVDGKRAESNTRLLPGQVLRIPPMPDAPAPKAAPRPIDARDAAALERLVIYRDDSVIALDKPQGMPVQGGPGIVKHLDGMLDALRFGQEDRPRLVHRLDRDTTGVLLLARTPAAASALARAFRGRDTQKTYWAIVVGRPHPLEGRISMPLAKHAGGHGERVVPSDARDAAHAVTLYRTVDTAQKRAAWLELTPLTGRTHQLRVHCAAALSCPILGDGKYGGAAAHPDGFGDRTLHLHARALHIPHPEGGMLELAAPLPPHMKDTFVFLGFDRPRTPPCRRLR
jgi:23S rRNA pseudouridine955/2504/2580 synthase